MRFSEDIMETTSQQTSMRAMLEAKIKVLEAEKNHLQQDIARVKEMLTTVALENKAHALEGEVAQLRSVKVKLKEQLPNSPRPTTNRPKENTRQARPEKKQQISQQSPVRYGTWSKLPLS